MSRVSIITGGATPERDVSLRSAGRVATVLKHLGHEVKIHDLDANLLAGLAAAKPDVVWPLVHGSIGEDGSLQDLLELANYSFIGTTSAGCRLASSKPVAKSVVSKNGLRTPESVALPKQLFRVIGDREILDYVERSIGLPVVIKPADGGSGLGITFTEESEQLPEAMALAFAYSDVVLIERAVSGREVSVSIIDTADGVTALPLVEVEVPGGRYDYDARYNAGDSQFFTPPRIDDEAKKAAKQLGLNCHRVLELSQLSRIDLIVDEQGVPWFIDANVVPGMTDTSLFPLAAEEGPGFAEVCGELVRKMTVTADA